MQTSSLFSAIQSSWFATLLDGSRYIAMGIQIVHLLSLTFLLALVLAINIRVLRLALCKLPVEQFAHSMTKPFQITLSVAIVAGILLFLPRAETYASNVAFVWKMGFLLVAGIGQLLLLRRLAGLPAQQEAPISFRAGSFVALLLWITTGVAGRAIGFV